MYTHYSEIVSEVARDINKVQIEQRGVRRTRKKLRRIKKVFATAIDKHFDFHLYALSYQLRNCVVRYIQRLETLLVLDCSQGECFDLQVRGAYMKSIESK